MWEDALEGPCVQHVLVFGDAVRDEEAAGIGGAYVSRH